MKNIQNKISNVFDRVGMVASKISENRFLKGLSSGMMATLPINIIGSFALILVVAPLGPISTLIENIGLDIILDEVFNYTVGLLAIYMTIFISKNLVNIYLPQDDGGMASVMALSGFLIMTPSGEIVNGDNVTTAIPNTWLGAQGAFTAIIVASIAAFIYKYCKENDLTIKMPAGVPPMVSNVFSGIIPFVFSSVFFGMVRYLSSLTEAGSFHQLVYSIIQLPMQSLGGNIYSVVIFAFLAQLLWFFGIHGQSVLSPFYTPIFLALDLQNMQALAAGEPLPNIIGFAFFEIFSFGGFQLALCIHLFRAKSKQFREFGKIGIVPALFGIGERLNFGMPLVLKFEFIIPFLFISPLMYIVAYLGIASGIFPRLNGYATVFGFPFGVNQFFQGGWSILLLGTIVNIILPYFLWLPFVRRADKKAYSLENEAENAESLDNVLEQ